VESHLQPHGSLRPHAAAPYGERAMAIKYSSEEILEMAEQIERNGVRFYEEAARRFALPVAKTVLTELQEMEKTHRDTFSTMRQDRHGVDPSLSEFDENHPAAQYVQSLADAQVFRGEENLEEVFSGYEQPSEIIEIAIQREKDSIVFYVGLLDLAAREEDQQAINHIIREEMDHVRRLYDLLAQL
jgi:rubrerythrin